MVASLSTTTVALWLGLYASAVSSLVALFTLYGDLFQRVTVITHEAHLVAVEGGRRLVMLGDAADESGVPEASRTPILSIAIRNRGRQPVQIRGVYKAYWLRIKREQFDELLPSFPLTVQPGHTETLSVGAHGDHDAGSVGEWRWFTLDGAGRIHPLRERWLQRLEKVLYRKAALLWRRRKMRHANERRLPA